MQSTQSRRLRTLLLALALVVGLISTAALLSACGEKVTEKAIEEAIEKAAEDNGDDVDVDIDTDEGKVSVSGENGETNWQSGENVDPPEGFPEGLLPEGAKIVTAVTSGEAQTVIFTSPTGAADTYDFYLKALPAAGFSIVNKMQMESNGEDTIAVMAENASTSVAVAGGTKSDEVYTYQIVVQPKNQ
jgi:hypothetical protein